MDDSLKISSFQTQTEFIVCVFMSSVEPDSVQVCSNGNQIIIKGTSPQCVMNVTVKLPSGVNHSRYEMTINAGVLKLIFKKDSAREGALGKGVGVTGRTTVVNDEHQAQGKSIAATVERSQVLGEGTAPNDDESPGTSTAVMENVTQTKDKVQFPSGRGMGLCNENQQSREEQLRSVSPGCSTRNPGNGGATQKRGCGQDHSNFQGFVKASRYMEQQQSVRSGLNQFNNPNSRDRFRFDMAQSSSPLSSVYLGESDFGNAKEHWRLQKTDMAQSSASGTAIENDDNDTDEMNEQSDDDSLGSETTCEDDFYPPSN